jgi:hypothetical protein
VVEGGRGAVVEDGGACIVMRPVFPILVVVALGNDHPSLYYYQTSLLSHGTLFLILSRRASGQTTT